MTDIDKDLACDGYGLTASQSMMNKLKRFKYFKNMLERFVEESNESANSKEDRKKNEK